MMNGRRTLSLLCALALALTLLTTCTVQSATADGAEPTIVRMKSVVYAAEITEDDPWHDTEMGKLLQEKLGIKLVVEPAGGADYTQSLSTFFAAGADADFLRFWGWEDQMALMKKAAIDGMVMDIKPFIGEQTPNLIEVVNPANMAPNLVSSFLYPPEYADKIYFLMNGFTDNEYSVGLQEMGVCARKDILDQLGVAPESVTTSDELYELMVKIRDLGLKDMDGNDLIVASNWEVGWDSTGFFRSFDFGNRTSFGKLEDGTVRHWFMTDWAEKRTLFMRKLIAENLLDKEYLTQTTEMSIAKLKRGQVGIFGLQASVPNNSTREIWDATKGGTHPEMKFVNIGPIKNHMGTTTKYQVPLSNAAICVLNTSKVPELCVKLIDFANSPEGRKLSNYGVEGKNFQMVDGFPRVLEEYRLGETEARNALNKETGYDKFGSVINELGVLNSGFNRMVLFGEPGVGLANDPVAMEEWIAERKFNTPTQVLAKGFAVSGFLAQYPDVESITPVLNQTRDVYEQAVFAKTEDEARKMIEDYRNTMNANGYPEYEKWLNEQCGGRDDIEYYLNW